MPGAAVLVATLKAKGCHTVLVTGGFRQFADPVASMLGFEHVVANQLEIARGKLTGRVSGAIVDSGVKRADRKSTRLNSSHERLSRMPSSA